MLIVAVLILLVFSGLIGLVTDTANLQVARQRAQTAADAAAIAAWHEFHNGNTAGMLRAAEGDAARNGVTAGEMAKIEVHCPPQVGDYSTDSNAVEASIVVQAPTIFMRVFGKSAVTVRARAVALAAQSGLVTLGE